jgi:hypothetical protein
MGAGGMTQVVEHLPSKCEALNPNPSTKKKRKKELMCSMNSLYKYKHLERNILQMTRQRNTV